MAVEFSTRDIHPRERLAYWREAMGVVPHEFRSSTGSAFLGTVHSEMLCDVLISDFRCDPCEVTRAARHIGQSDCDDFLLCVQLSGRAVFSQEDRQGVAEKGSFVLIDPRRPFSVSYQGATRSVSLTLPRRAFEARLGDASGLTAQTMEARRPLAGLTSGLLSMLPTRIESLGSVARSKLAEQALDMIALTFSLEGCRAGVNLSSCRATTLLRLKAAIECRLQDPELKPAVAAAAAGISVRYANDLLSQESSSVERYILHRRLERCRRALEDRDQDGRLIGEIAFGWGFSDLSHFARRFRAAYGFAPSDYRASAQERTALLGGTTAV